MTAHGITLFPDYMELSIKFQQYMHSIEQNYHTLKKAVFMGLPNRLLPHFSLFTFCMIFKTELLLSDLATVCFPLAIVLHTELMVNLKNKGLLICNKFYASM